MWMKTMKSKVSFKHATRHVLICAIQADWLKKLENMLFQITTCRKNQIPDNNLNLWKVLIFFFNR